MALKCPNCGHAAHTRSARDLAPGLKEAYYQCQNIECSGTFRTREEFVNWTSKPVPSGLTEEEKQALWDACQPTKGIKK